MLSLLKSFSFFYTTAHHFAGEDGFVGESIWLSLFGPRFNKNSKRIVYMYSETLFSFLLHHSWAKYLS